MRVCLICSSLEPGKHGIGDYSRKITDHLMIKGIEVLLLAINDPFIENPIFGNKETVDKNFYVLRMPARWKISKRIVIAKERIDAFGPEWICFQACLFSYSRRGLPINLISLLRSAGKHRKWLIMFHELWLGEAKSDPLKHKILGQMQKKLVQVLLKEFLPVKVFTSNRFYQMCLEHIGVKARIVPIFSNIPLAITKSSRLFDNLPKEVQTNRERFLIASFFGSMHFSYELESKVLRLLNLSKRENKELLITHLGRSEGVAEHFKRWKTKMGIHTISFGMQDGVSIAQFFRKIDLGLSTYPKILLEKSGSIAAMNLNGLPVILMRKSFFPDDREFSWIEEVDEISSLGDFITRAKPQDSDFDIESTVEAYYEALMENISNKIGA